MTLDKDQAGFTLIEAIIATVIMLSVIAVFGTFLMRFQKSAAGYTERAKQTEDTSLTSQVLIRDLENAGANLTLNSKQNFTGEMSVSFASNSDYQTRGTRIERIGQKSDGVLRSSLLWLGKGLLSWRGTAFSVTVGDDQRSRRIISDGSTATVFEDSWERASISLSGQETAFSISVSNVVVDGTVMCRSEFRVDGQLAFQAVSNCSMSAEGVSVEMPVGSSIDSMVLNAAEITMRDTGISPARLPLLPYFGTTRIDSPVIRTENGFILFAGDTSLDALFLASEKTFDLTTSQYINIGDTTGVAAGDVLLVCDILNSRSVMLVVSDAQSTQLVVRPVYQAGGTAGAFASMYTPVSDFEGFAFRSGTRVVRLSAPVEYAVREDEGVTSLFRRRPASAWELVVPSLNDFDLNIEASPSRYGVDISFQVLSEGIENAVIAQPVRISVNPSALNRTFEAR